jgi:site-specific DNA-cytosine methylase
LVENSIPLILPKNYPFLVFLPQTRRRLVIMCIKESDCKYNYKKINTSADLPVNNIFEYLGKRGIEIKTLPSWVIYVESSVFNCF